MNVSVGESPPPHIQGNYKNLVFFRFFCLLKQKKILHKIFYDNICDYVKFQGIQKL